MSRFIKLTDAGPVPSYLNGGVWVNMEHIAFFRTYSDDKVGEHTRLFEPGAADGYYQVKEAPEEILMLIQQQLMRPE